MTAVLLLIAAVLIVADWVIVWRGAAGRARWLTKPGAMIALIAVALTADAGGAVHSWILAGLVLSLAGDVFLLLPERWFVAGLGAFLVAHVAYIVGMTQLDLHPWHLVVPAAIASGAWLQVGRPIVQGAAERDPAMRIPVLLYVTVISLMVLVAGTTAEPWLYAAAGLFYASDAVLGTNRFVRSRPWMPPIVMVTYHLAQLGFVVFLLRR